MDERTLDALKASIKHWEENAAAEQPSEASDNPSKCALCQLFNSPRGDQPRYKRCLGCPVYETTGNLLCAGTPYDDASAALENWNLDYTDRPRENIARAKQQFKRWAEREVTFLRSLLPEGENAP